VSLQHLTDEVLIEAYNKAKELQLDPTFIQILCKELHRRHLFVN